MIRLKNWYFSEHDGNVYFGMGIAYGHPRINDGVQVHTSKVARVVEDLSNSRFIMDTSSGSEYSLSFDEASMDSLDKTEWYLKSFGVSDIVISEFDRIMKARIDRLYASISGILDCNELLLILLESNYCVGAYYKNGNGYVRKISVQKHIGSRKDSYIIASSEESVYFSYFDNYFGIKPYHWSDNINTVKINNVGNSDLEFVCADRIICKTGEITVIDRSKFNYDKISLVSVEDVESI